MPKKQNWKTKAAEQYHTAIATAEAMKESEDKRAAGIALVHVGRAMALQELLAEYGVDVEEDTKPKIILVH